MAQVVHRHQVTMSIVEWFGKTLRIAAFGVPLWVRNSDHDSTYQPGECR